MKNEDVETIVSKLDFKSLLVLRLVAYRADPMLMRSYLTSYASNNGKQLLVPTDDDIKDLLKDMELKLDGRNVEGASEQSSKV